MKPPYNPTPNDNDEQLILEQKVSAAAANVLMIMQDCVELLTNTRSLAELNALNQ